MGAPAINAPRIRRALIGGALAGLFVLGVALAVLHFELHGGLVAAALVLAISAGPILARARR